MLSFTFFQSIGLPAHRVVEESHRGSAVGIDRVRQAAPAVVGVVGDYAAGPDALREPAGEEMADSMEVRFHCAILYQIHLRNASA